MYVYVCIVHIQCIYIWKDLTKPQKSSLSIRKIERSIVLIFDIDPCIASIFTII